MEIITSLNRKADLNFFIFKRKIEYTVILLWNYEVIFDLTIFSFVLKAETHLNVQRCKHTFIWT